MQDTYEVIRANSEHQKKLLAAARVLVDRYSQQLQAKRDNEAAHALFRALGWAN